MRCIRHQTHTHTHSHRHTHAYSTYCANAVAKKEKKTRKPQRTSTRPGQRRNWRLAEKKTPARERECTRSPRYRRRPRANSGQELKQQRAHCSEDCPTSREDAPSLLRISRERRHRNWSRGSTFLERLGLRTASVWANLSRDRMLEEEKWSQIDFHVPSDFCGLLEPARNSFGEG